mgnify:CR=1 FL=1|jgi:CBS domain-containing protein
MPRAIVESTIREVEPLRESDTVEDATKRVLEAGLPALPVVDERGRFAGIFGEREFMTALFPGWIRTVGWSAMLTRSLDDVIQQREECRTEAIDRYLTRDHVLVDEDFADAHIAEIFLHHRVLIVPVARNGEVYGVITRSDFFRVFAERFVAAGE